MKMNSRWCWAGGLAVAVLLQTMGPLALHAQEPAPATAVEAPAAPAETPPAAEAPAAAPEEAAPAAAPPSNLPPYMSAISPDEKTPLWPDATGAKSGSWTAPSAGPVGDGDPSQRTPADLYDRIAHNLYSINTIWILVAGFLVMFMQTGFAMVEGGLCRAKNASHTFAMNLMVYPLGCIAFYVYGFGLGWGNWWNAPVADGWYSPMGPGTSLLNAGYSVDLFGSNWVLFGTKGFCLYGMEDASIMTLFFFMMVFMDTTATIPTGAMAERWGWNNFVIYSLWVALPYCLFANWVWGGGWLAQLGKNCGFGHGAVDFAGSAVVHAMGGAIALAGAIVIGPRIGKFVNGKPQAIPGHSVPFVVLGTFILAFGWFGFNAGSTLSGTDLRMSVVVVNTMLAGVTAAIASMWYMQLQGMKPDPSMICNGMLAGLVAITCPCAFVGHLESVIIGAIAGVLVVISVFFWDRMGVDDPVGAISVHGICGSWGVLSLGIFANGKYGGGWNGVQRTEWIDKVLPDGSKLGADNVRGLLYGDSSQIIAQAITVATVWIFGFIMAYVWFKFSNLIFPIRVTREVELEGLDGPEMGSLGYPDFALKGGALDA